MIKNFNKRIVHDMKVFEQAERKFMKEIDVVNILETVQKTKLLYASGLKEHQKVLSNF